MKNILLLAVLMVLCTDAGASWSKSYNSYKDSYRNSYRDSYHTNYYGNYDAHYSKHTYKKSESSSVEKNTKQANPYKEHYCSELDEYAPEWKKEDCIED